MRVDPFAHQSSPSPSAKEASENRRLRAIFPKILAAMDGQGGACSANCSVEFYEQIPAEIRAVFLKLKQPA